jgi:exopolysaccharide biosynthesis polyprenyl glycosylphosphotransferase
VYQPLKCVDRPGFRNFNFHSTVTHPGLEISTTVNVKLFRMSKLTEKILTLLSDLMGINVSFFIIFMGINVGVRFGIRWFANCPVELDIVAATTLSIYWPVLFLLFGLYKSWYNCSRVDEFFQVLKSSFFGIVILSIITLNLRGSLLLSIFMLTVYWILLYVFICAGRFGVRSLHRHLLVLGIGRKNTLIVGGGAMGEDLLKKIRGHPALGYEVIGFVDRNPNAAKNGLNGVPFLGTYEQISQLVSSSGVSDIIIAVESGSHQEILDIIDRCNGLPVNLKIVPDVYDIASGHIKTQEIIGFPLIDLLPEPMSPSQQLIKRAMDIVIASIVLLFFWPVWVVIAMLVRLDTKGNVFFSQDRVGKDGKVFTMIKFRSMVRDAEKRTGPIWAGEDDFRITRVGRVLRKFRLDEIPQFLNILKGEMSLVGPRPERSYFVEQFKHKMPLYTKRLKVRPGLTGWAQTRHKYDASLDDVREKLKYDLYYLRNMSLMLDLKIIIETVGVMIKGKGAH